MARALPWLEIYGVVVIAVLWSPWGISHPLLKSMSFLPDRASLYSILFLSAALVSIGKAKWHAVAWVAIAVVFFGMLYRDTGTLEQWEQNVETAVAPLKPGDRVIATLFPLPHSRIHQQHIVDRACIGHCYYVAHYEPAAQQFRVRASEQNRIVNPSSGEIDAMKVGKYPVRPEDLPLLELYACGPALQSVCLHQLQAGEYNGRVAYEQYRAFIEGGQGEGRNTVTR